ncbi:MAG: DUF6798 domain-containing protein, partial [Saprospiraceae bacterium]
GLYLLLGDYFRLEFVLQFQWMKTTIWIELFTVIGGLLFISKFSVVKNVKYISAACFLGIAIASFYITKPNASLTMEEDKLAEWSRTHTDINSLFVYPPTFNRFKTVSERSSWIDFKAITHQKAYLIPWYDRVNRIFKIDLKDRQNGVNLIEQANKNYIKINDHDLSFLLYSQSVDYIILPTQLEPSEYMYPAYSTEHFTIYKRVDLN